MKACKHFGPLRWVPPYIFGAWRN